MEGQPHEIAPMEHKLIKIFLLQQVLHKFITLLLWDNVGNLIQEPKYFGG